MLVYLKILKALWKEFRGNLYEELLALCEDNYGEAKELGYNNVDYVLSIIDNHFELSIELTDTQRSIFSELLVKKESIEAGYRVCESIAA